jgi:hypothetical protein
MAPSSRFSLSLQAERHLGRGLPGEAIISGLHQSGPVSSPDYLFFPSDRHGFLKNRHGFA